MKLTFKKMTAMLSMLLAAANVYGDGCSAVRILPCR